MSKNTELTPATLYARVSSDRQDVDISVAAQLRVITDCAERIGTTAGPRSQTGARNTRLAPARR